ncbi:MAG TPA: hypothetical protein VIH29_00445 [Gallionella sp.]
MTKERPILFSAPMVRALLDGGKTQTRRTVKPQPSSKLCKECNPTTKSVYAALFDGKRIPCPYGQPGDRLWVRETWRIGAWNEDGGEIAVDYLADNHSRREWLQVPEADDFEKYWLQCCDDCDKAGEKTDEEGKYHWQPSQSPCRIHPSIFMPRWASRITLEILSMRVERVQDINYKDALAEGVSDMYALLHKDWKPLDGESGNDTGRRLKWPQRLYQQLWKSINGPGSWDVNPWVWAIEFKRGKP